MLGTLLKHNSSSNYYRLRGKAWWRLLCDHHRLGYHWIRLSRIHNDRGRSYNHRSLRHWLHHRVHPHLSRIPHHNLAWHCTSRAWLHHDGSRSNHTVLGIWCAGRINMRSVFTVENLLLCNGRVLLIVDLALIILKLFALACAQVLNDLAPLNTSSLADCMSRHHENDEA